MRPSHRDGPAGFRMPWCMMESGDKQRSNNDPLNLSGFFRLTRLFPTEIPLKLSGLFLPKRPMEKQSNSPALRAAAPPPDGFDLGTWLGRRQAFGLIAGKTAAGDAECLRQIRDRKMYKAKTSSWDQFCTQYVGASRAQVNRVIGYLEQFGPAFFEVTQLTRIPPETYRAIAPHVTTDGLVFDGVVISLVQENSQRLAQAVAELRKRAEPKRTGQTLKAVMPRTDSGALLFTNWNCFK